MFRKLISLSVIVCLIVSTSGCASYQFGRLPSPYIIDYPENVSQKGVSVAAEVFSPDKSLMTFDCEMCKRKIQPAFLVIDNKSDTPYSFRKADVDPNYLPAERVAKKCSRSTMGRVLGYGFLGLFIITWIIFIPMAIAESVNCPKINSRMRSDYVESEIPDGTIGVGRSLSGVIFLPQFSSDDKLIVPLVNRETGERILFRAHNYESPYQKKQEVNKEEQVEASVDNEKDISSGKDEDQTQ